MTDGETVPGDLTTALAAELYHTLRRDFTAARTQGWAREPEALQIAVMRSLLAAMVIRRLGAEPPLSEITAFLATPRVPIHRQPMSVIDAEAVLRDALGEAEIKRGMEREAEVHALYHVLVYLADDLKLPVADLADTITRAERTARASFTGDMP
jgi:hypothetical protein